MHCIVIKDEILERYPWVSLSLAKAWAEARKIMHEHLPRQSSSLLWYRDYWLEQRAIFGDLWAYGLPANRHVIEQEIEYELEQGILKTRPKVEDLFAKNTLDWQEQERWTGMSGRI
jgi:4,5-dihydroxyphthalate decarboxylase